jgi:hypothetical protein
VFGWLSKRGRRVRAMGRVIHEMCYQAHRLRDTLDAPLHSHFIAYPMLKYHGAPKSTDSDQVHIFWISDGRQSFDIMVCDGEAWLAVCPDGDFAGAYVQSGRMDHYVVRLDQAFARPQGHLATKLVQEFVARYAAVAAS